MEKKVHVEALNLRHLRAWAVVVDEGSITAGAKKLGVSQPALSQQLKALEDFFGGHLLERLPRGTKPTALGTSLLAEARATLAVSERLLRRAVPSDGLFSGMLEIAALPTLVDGLMMEPIKEWQSLHPKVSIRIREFAMQQALIEEFELGLADVALGVLPPNWSGRSHSLGWDEFVVILPQNHPLHHSKEPVDLRELKDDRWMLYGKSQGLSDYMIGACAWAGFRPIEAVRTSQARVAIQLACAGMGNALVPRLNVPVELKGFAKQLKQRFAWEIAALSRSDFSDAARNFVALIDTGRLIEKPEGAISLLG
ncbi:LysR family transcriptional regulator [Ruegeria atlantica]|uniref:LysR family transcriptional regulator n=1 Tax=Ruegeria atlantica TaxID=81569 RepID=UPI00147B3D52|nr:LysR family transcriptional regulator [Ruegeria atlantica]